MLHKRSNRQDAAMPGSRFHPDTLGRGIVLPYKEAADRRLPAEGGRQTHLERAKLGNKGAIRQRHHGTRRNG